MWELFWRNLRKKVMVPSRRSGCKKTCIYQLNLINCTVFIKLYYLHMCYIILLNQLFFPELTYLQNLFIPSLSIDCGIDQSFFLFFFYFIFPLYSKGVRLSLDVYIAITVFSPTLSSVATWVSRHSSQCYSAGSPCKSILGCVWYILFLN